MEGRREGKKQRREGEKKERGEEGGWEVERERWMERGREGRKEG